MALETLGVDDLDANDGYATSGVASASAAEASAINLSWPPKTPSSRILSAALFVLSSNFETFSVCLDSCSSSFSYWFLDCKISAAIPMPSVLSSSTLAFTDAYFLISSFSWVFFSDLTDYFWLV